MGWKKRAAVCCAAALIGASFQSAGAAWRESGQGGAGEVAWTVRFVSADDRNLEIFREEAGIMSATGRLEITFPETVIGSDGYYWKALKRSPQRETAHGTGTQKYAVEYRRGDRAKGPTGQEENRKKLEEWTAAARELNGRLSGSEADRAAVVVKNRAENDAMVIQLSSMADDAKRHEIYVIGENYLPQSLAISRLNENFTNVSNVLIEEFTCGKAVYYVSRIGFERVFAQTKCAHRWETVENVENSCLEAGERTAVCAKCRARETVLIPASGHADENQDSLCDHCGQRVFAQAAGDVIGAWLAAGDGRIPLEFVCVDADYMGAMLYVSREVIPAGVAGGYGQGEYAGSDIRAWLDGEFIGGLSLRAACLPFERPDGDLLKDDAVLMTKEEYLKYQDFWDKEGSFYTRSALDGTSVWGISGGAAVSAGPDDRSFGFRPAILLRKPVFSGEARPVHVSVGDRQAREIAGRTYTFTCVDDDYADTRGHNRATALFLCDSVIRSDIVSTKTAKKTLVFGVANNYKKSDVRAWLIQGTKSSRFGMEPVETGVNSAALGSTAPGSRAQFIPEQIKMMKISPQFIEDSIFILSLEEAFRYPDEIFAFGEGGAEAQISAYSKGYWLRTPGDRRDERGSFVDGEEVYVVDLANGNIHPAGAGDASFGIRPAYTTRQE